MVGEAIGPYRILAKLGEGGMGEVYRARDARLNRDVALKVLPESFAADAGRLARFEREAQVLASLNHPHIAQIYGVEQSDGVRGLVMELVEGPTLAGRIEGGALAVEDALAIARQIADALAAAHEQGIVHRDLKPSNVKVRPDGTVKLLDFGLAKALEPAVAAAPRAGVTQSPTITTPAMTRAGIILGTPAYMSPEQARGRQADRRADVWAFGCVLFEMLTGRRAFGGDEVADTLAFVLTKEPPWETLPADLPEAVRRLLRRCLSKDPKHRLRDMGDARLELDEASPPAPGRVGNGPRFGHGERLAWTLAALGIAAAAIAVWWTPDTPDEPETHVDINVPGLLPFYLSPDGRKIVFPVDGNTGRRLWIRHLDRATPEPLRGTEDGLRAFWSPDSRSIGFFTSTELKRLDLETGEVTPLAKVITPAGGTWNRDDTILYVPNDNDGVWRIPAKGGETVKVTPPRSPALAIRSPHFLPDQRHYLFYVARGAEPAGVYVGDIDSPTITRLVSADSPAVYGAGHLWFVRGETLFAQRFEPDTLQVSGAVIEIAEDIANLDTGAAISASATGSVAYRSSLGIRRRLSWVDREGNELGSAGDDDLAAALSNPSMSRDGRYLLVQRNVQRNPDIWLVDLDRNRSVQQTFNPGIDAMPLFAPDGGRFVFSSSQEGTSTIGLFVQSLDTRDPMELPIPERRGTIVVSDWSRDGKFLLYKQFVDAAGGQTDLWAMPMDGSGTPVAVIQSAADERDAQFSPDGKWIAYESNETNRPEIYLRPFPGPGRAETISTAGGTQVRWDHEGRELFYISVDGTMTSVPIDLSASPPKIGTPIPLFTRRRIPMNAVARQQYVVHPDGKRFLMVTGDQEYASPIRLMLNWRPPVE